MLSKLYIVKIDCHILENSLSSVKFLMYIRLHQINSNTVPTIFLNKFKKPTHNYPTIFAGTNYSIPPFKLNESKHCISI